METKTKIIASAVQRYVQAAKNFEAASTEFNNACEGVRCVRTVDLAASFFSMIAQVQPCVI